MNSEADTVETTHASLSIERGKPNPGKGKGAFLCGERRVVTSYGNDCHDCAVIKKVAPSG